MQLACPVPEGTRTLADGNAYTGGVPRPYIVDVRRQSTQDWFNYTLDDVNQSATRYPIHVAWLQLGVTTVRLRADVRNRARNLPQPTVTLTLALALTLASPLPLTITLTLNLHPHPNLTLAPYAYSYAWPAHGRLRLRVRVRVRVRVLTLTLILTL